MTGSLFVLIFANLAAQFGINLWNRKIFDALEQRDSDTVLYMSFVFFPLAAASVSIGVTNVWVRMTTQRRWRAWVSDAVISRWLKNGRYYQLNLVSGDHQNPGGRLTDDLRVATDAPVDFAVGVVQASLSALTFIAVLWTIGGALTVQRRRDGHHHPRFFGFRGGGLRRARERRDDRHRQDNSFPSRKRKIRPKRPTAIN